MEYWRIPESCWIYSLDKVNFFYYLGYINLLDKEITSFLEVLFMGQSYPSKIFISVNPKKPFFAVISWLWAVRIKSIWWIETWLVREDLKMQNLNRMQQKESLSIASFQSKSICFQFSQLSSSITMKRLVLSLFRI